MLCWRVREEKEIEEGIFKYSGNVYNELKKEFCYNDMLVMKITLSKLHKHYCVVICNFYFILWKHFTFLGITISINSIICINYLFKGPK